MRANKFFNNILFIEKNQQIKKSKLIMNNKSSPWQGLLTFIGFCILIVGILVLLATFLYLILYAI